MAARRLGLGDYVRRRNGVPLGAPGALRAMLRRAFGAGSFAGFWRYWNPIFGYALGRYVHAPLRRVLPDGLALVLTFLVCGALHDGVSMLVSGRPAFLFTPWFLFLGGGVVLGDALRLDWRDRAFALRAGIHLAYLAACALGAYALRAILLG